MPTVTRLDTWTKDRAPRDRRPDRRPGSVRDPYRPVALAFSLAGWTPAAFRAAFSGTEISPEITGALAASLAALPSGRTTGT